MSKRKPDRWEREAEKAVGFQNMYEDDEGWVLKSDVVNLLRKQHQWVVQLHQKEAALCRANADIGGLDGVAHGWHCREAACKDLLAKLKERAK